MVVQLGLEAHSVSDMLLMDTLCIANPFCGGLKYLKSFM